MSFRAKTGTSPQNSLTGIKQTYSLTIIKLYSHRPAPGRWRTIVSHADTLGQTLALTCGTTLKNRIAKSAMSEALGTIDNHVTPALERLYGR